MPRFYETTLSITNLHNLSISTHVNRSRIYENGNKVKLDFFSFRCNHILVITNTYKPYTNT